MRRILRTLLHSFGAREVYEAEDGATALEMYSHYVPDIVITDWAMPIFDGLELAQMIRQPDSKGNPYAPIIMLTGHSEKRRVTVARDAGVTEFLAKPISAKGLYQRILNVVANPRPFIKTKTYFGPDRRRNTTNAYIGPERRIGGEVEVMQQPSLLDKARSSRLARRPRRDHHGESKNPATLQVKAFADHHVITQPNPLRKVLLRVPESDLDDPVARAEKALAGLSGEFKNWMAIEADRLVGGACRHSARRLHRRHARRAVSRRPRHQGRRRHVRLSLRRRRRRKPVPHHRTRARPRPGAGGTDRAITSTPFRRSCANAPSSTPRRWPAS